jgi:hypothetical protein
MGDPLPDEAVDALIKLRTDLSGDDFPAALREHITSREVSALRRRTGRLLANAVYPQPGGEWRAIPWPAF